MEREMGEVVEITTTESPMLDSVGEGKVPGNHALNITNLPSGLYLLIMVYNEAIDYAKFIKQ
jgi:hypothetical protein